MDGLHAGEHLLAHHAYGLLCEFPTTQVKEVFKTRAKEVDDENIVQSFLSKIVNTRNALCIHIRSSASVI